MLDRSDSWHARVLGWWREAAREVRLPVTVLPEITYLLERRIGVQAEEAFVRAVADGEFDIESLEDADLARAADLLGVYRDAPLGFVDASVVAIAERLGVTTVLTTDRRHFALVRPSHVPALRLVP